MVLGLPVADFIQIIIGVLSLIATIAVSFVVYWMQRQHEKEREEYERKAYEKSIQDTARMFIIDNEEELVFLPLCQISEMLYPNHRHVRNIYTRYNMCSAEVKKEILKQTNTPIIPEITFHTLSGFIDCYNNAVKDCKLSTRDFLYDGAKYFHRAFQMYSKVIVENLDPFCFDTPFLTPIQKELGARQSLTTYIREYLQALSGNNNEIERLTAPLDDVWVTIAPAQQESDVTFWVMRMIISSCYAMVAQGIIPERSDRIPFEEFWIATQEDMYYYTILVLLYTYGDNGRIDLS